MSARLIAPTLVALLAAAALSGCGGSSEPTTRTHASTNDDPLVSHADVGPTGATAPGAPTALAPSTPMRLTVALNSQDASGMQAYATGVSTPGNPLYGHYLTPQQFAARFGATPEAIAAVQSFLRAGGLQVGVPSANDLTLDVSGTAAQVERTLQVQLVTVRIGGRTAFMNTAAPVLPASVAGYLQGIIGLDDRYPAQPAVAQAG